MNVNLGTATAYIDLDSSRFSVGIARAGTSLASISRESRKTESEFKSLNTSLTGSGNYFKRLDLQAQSLGNKLKATQGVARTYGQAMQDTSKSVKDAEKEHENLGKKMTTLQGHLQRANQMYGENSKQSQMYAKAINSVEKQQTNLEREIEQGNIAIEEFGIAMKNAETQATGLQRELKNFKIKQIGQDMTQLGKTLTRNVTVPIVGLAGAAAKSAIDFESAFAGVRKTVDASEADMNKLESGIRNMAKEMPTAATEIAGVAEAAGQLGIKTDSILGFTKTMVMLGDSTNMSAEEAATSLARLANITGMSQSDFDKLGSTIVALGNNLATTEAEITEMGLRLAGAGKQVGLSEAQIVSFAGALSSVGIEAEAGGTAFSKVMTEIQRASTEGGESLNQFAEIAGMSASDFKKAYEEDAAGALIKFIEGLGKAEEKGTTANAMLDELGITETRMRDALLRAAGASDVFSEALEIGTNAWGENNALTKEAEQRYETTASKLLILKNNLVEVGIQIGDILLPYIQEFVDWLQGLIEKFQGLEPSTQDFIVKAGLMLAIVGPLVWIFGGLISAVSTIGGALSGLAGMFGLTSGAAAGASGAVGGVGLASGAVAGFLKGGFIGALVAVIAKVGESETALAWLQEKFGSLGVIVGAVCEFISGIWTITIDNIISIVKFGLDTIASIIDGPGGKTIEDSFKKHQEEVQKNTEEAWKKLTLTTTRELSQQKNSVDTETKDAANKANTNTQEMANSVEQNSKQAADAMKHNMSATSKVVFDESGKIPKDVQSNMSKSVQAMRQAGSDIYNGMNTSFSKLASQGKQHFSDLYNGVTRSTSKMASQVIGDWEDIRDSLSRSITGNVNIQVHGVQTALNKIAIVKNAARHRRSISFASIQKQPRLYMNFAAIQRKPNPYMSFATIPNNMYAQAYEMVRSSYIASSMYSTGSKKTNSTTSNYNIRDKEIDKLGKVISDKFEKAIEVLLDGVNNDFVVNVDGREIAKVVSPILASGTRGI